MISHFIKILLLASIFLLFVFAIRTIYPQEDHTNKQIEKLLTTLKTTNDNNEIEESIVALGYLGKEAVPVLIETLKTNNSDSLKIKVAECIAKIGFQAEEAVPVLIEILKKSNNSEVIDSVSTALGAIGSKSQDSIPELFSLLETRKDKESYRIILFSIHKILNDLIQKSDFSNGEIIVNAYNKSRTNFREEGIGILEGDIYLIKFKLSLKEATPFSYIDFGYFWSTVYLFIPTITIVYLIFHFFPVAIINFHEKFLISIEVNFLRTLKVPIQTLSLVFIFTNRALDQWIKTHLSTVNQRFLMKKTVDDRKIYVPVTVFMDNETFSDFQVEDLDEILETNQIRLLISGEGGVGKTSLACQLAKWSLLEDETERLFTSHIAIPILLENDLTSNTDLLLKTVSHQLKDLIDSANPISDGLVRALLKSKRLILIIDGISEMNTETKSTILLGINDIVANAVIFTSRSEDFVGNLTVTNITPIKIKGNELSSFVEGYLTKIGKKNLFTDTEFFNGCISLSAIIGERNVTALIAKLFVDQMIAQKEGSFDEDLPQNIPQLMQQSIKVLYTKTPSNNLDLKDIINLAKLIAWKCLKKDFHPQPIDLEDCFKGLEKINNGEIILQFLIENLMLLEKKGFSNEKIVFKIDPLAEYLAAMYVVENNKYKEKEWRILVEELNSKVEASKNITGFLLALIDCCLIEDTNKILPHFLIDELNQLKENSFNKAS